MIMMEQITTKNFIVSWKHKETMDKECLLCDKQAFYMVQSKVTTLYLCQECYIELGSSVTQAIVQGMLKNDL